MRRYVSYALVFMLCLNLLAFIPPFERVAVRGSVSSWYATSVYDDAEERNDNTNFDSTQDYVLVVRMSSESSNYHGGFNIPDVTIPSGSTVYDANLSLYVHSASYDDIASTLYGNDVDDGQDFLSNADIYNRLGTLTSASHGYYINSLGVGWYDFNVTDIVVELVARGGWSSGNNMTFIFYTTGTGVKQFRCRSYDYDTHQYAPYLTVNYSVPAGTPVYHDVENESGVYDSSTYYWLNSTVELNSGIEDLVNVTLGLTHGIVLDYDNATDSFSEYADPNNYVTLGTSTKTDLNSTFCEVAYNVSFVDSMPNGYVDVILSDTLAFSDSGDNGTYSENDLFLFLNSSVVLRLEDDEFSWGTSNHTSNIIWHENETEEAYINTFDDSTFSTRSLSDFGSDQTNYATLYVVGYDFVYGWSDTIYDIYRNQSYECIGEAGYEDWNYNGLVAPPSFPSSYVNPNIPWYVPIIGYLISLLLPMMIVAYYWNRAYNFKTGLMVFLVAILCAMFMIMGWYLSDSLMIYIYQ